MLLNIQTVTYWLVYSTFSLTIDTCKYFHFDSIFPTDIHVTIDFFNISSSHCFSGSFHTVTICLNPFGTLVTIAYHLSPFTIENMIFNWNTMLFFLRFFSNQCIVHTLFRYITGDGRGIKSPFSINLPMGHLLAGQFHSLILMLFYYCKTLDRFLFLPVTAHICVCQPTNSTLF